MVLVGDRRINHMYMSIIGSGYIGTTVADCFADLDHEVVNIDINKSVVETINAGEAPIHGKGSPTSSLNTPARTAQAASRRPPTTTRSSTPT